MHGAHGAASQTALLPGSRRVAGWARAARGMSNGKMNQSPLMARRAQAGPAGPSMHPSPMPRRLGYPCAPPGLTGMLLCSIPCVGSGRRESLAGWCSRPLPTCPSLAAAWPGPVAPLHPRPASAMRGRGGALRGRARIDHARLRGEASVLQRPVPGGLAASRGGRAVIAPESPCGAPHGAPHRAPKPSSTPRRRGASRRRDSSGAWQGVSLGVLYHSPFQGASRTPPPAAASLRAKCEARRRGCALHQPERYKTRLPGRRGLVGGLPRSAVSWPYLRSCGGMA